MPSASADPFGLARFERAQAATFDAALAEIAAGRKESHWMWFIFPQLRGLGHSEMATFYAVGSIDEARAYLTHPILGRRLEKCVSTLNELAPRRLSAAQIFGELDAMKLRSSLTLFSVAAPDNPLFEAALAIYFAGQKDRRTLELLSARDSGRKE